MIITSRETIEAYSPATVRELRAAFQVSWDVLSMHRDSLVNEWRREQTREALARRLLKCAADGETNPSRLVTYALGPFV